MFCKYDESIKERASEGPESEKHVPGFLKRMRDLRVAKDVSGKEKLEC